MNIKQKLFIRNKKKKLLNKWYELVKPLAKYLSKREEKKYQKIKDSITEEQAIRWFAESIINYIIRYHRNEPFSLVIATWINDDNHSEYYCIDDCSFKQLLKKQKHRIAFYKFNKDIQFQEKVVNILRNTTGIVITEKIENFYIKPKDYQKTYFIKLAE